MWEPRVKLLPSSPIGLIEVISKCLVQSNLLTSASLTKWKGVGEELMKERSCSGVADMTVEKQRCSEKLC